MLRAPPVMLRAPPCHAARSRSIQKMAIERFNPRVAGFRDCARNDEVERFKTGVAGFRDWRGMTKWKT